MNLKAGKIIEQKIVDKFKANSLTTGRCTPSSDIHIQNEK